MFADPEQIITLPDGSQKRLGQCTKEDVAALIESLKCQDCEAMAASPLHECPYQSEINDEHAKCNCCEDCMDECRDAI